MPLLSRPLSAVSRLRRSLIVLGLLGAPAAVHAQVPAFPGAEGYGAYATGGRGGDVYYVTNLSSSATDAGSLSYGLANAPSAGRTIVFAVSGYIHINGLRLTKPKVTIAGQTAPGDGVGLKDGTFRISSSDVVVRHLRLRHGKYGSGGDCLNLDSASTNTVLDHISMQFSTDENMSSYSTPPENLTLQYSLNAWGLETHSCGGLWDQNHATAHHTLWAHNHTRNPKARPNGLLEWVNNVTYDWDIGFIMGDSYTPSSWKANVRSNYFICPPGNIRTYILEKGWLDRNASRKPTFSIYLDNNFMDRDGDGILNGSLVGYERVQGGEFDPAEVVPDYATQADVPRYYKNATPFAGSAAGVAIDSARLAYKKIVSNAGALRLDATYGGALRDEVDSILIDKLVTQTPFHVTRESDTGASNAGFGTLNSTAAPLDTDRDGMPDAWETALGWTVATQDHNTALASSGGILTGTTFFPAGAPAGYTRLEEYLHFKASPHATVARNTAETPSAITVDLSRYTLGFNTLAPTFALANVVGGSAVQSAPGSATVTFTPTLGYAGRARFEFTVADSQGDAWTQSFLLLVSNSGVPRDLVWIGDGATNAWNTTSANWSRNGGPVVFASGDHALFDDRGSASPALSLAENLAVGTLAFDSSKNYTLTGAGSVSAAGTLTKRGSGTLTLSNTTANSFASVIHEAGSLVLGSSTAAGSAKLSLQGGALTLSAASNSSVSNPFEFVAPTTVNVTTQHNATGSWTGYGDVTINTSSLWTIGGSWCGYSGRILFGSGNPRVRLNTTSNVNFGSASLAIDLGAGTGQLMNRNGGATAYALGTLTGGPGTQLFGTQTGTNASTYSIGARGENALFQGSIRNGGNATAPALTHITKVGTGAWTLSGDSTHTGNTTVSAGTLRLNGAFSASPVIVASGATLSGAGSTGGLVTVQSGGKLEPGATDNAAGVFTAAAGFTPASGSTLVFDLGATPAAASDKIQVSAGTLALAGTINFQLNFLDLAQGVSAGTYPLITGASTLSASGPVLTPVLPAAAGTTRQTFAFSRPASGSTPAYVNLVVSGDAASLVWSGPSGGIWDLNTTSGNFSGGPTSTFYNLDRVAFDDTGAGGSVVLSGTLQPSLLTVANSVKAYSFDGSGVLGGAMKLVKNGSGALTLANTAANTFTGGVELNAGILALSSTLAPLGTGSVRLNGGTLQLPSSGGIFLNNSFVFSGNSTIALGTSGNSNLPNSTANTFTSVGDATLRLSGANGILSVNSPMDGFSGKIDWGSSSVMLRLNANSSASADVNRGSASAHFALGTGGGRLVNRNGDITIDLGAVSGGPSTLLSGRQSGSGNTATTYRVGALGIDTTFAGSIQTGGDLAGLQIVKTGFGAWTLSGSSDYAGSLDLESGRIVLSGSLACTGNVDVQALGTLEFSGGTLRTPALDVDASGIVTGLGTIDGDLNNRGTVAAAGPGAFVVTGDVVNDGTIRLTGGASLSSTGSFVNNGVLDLLTAGGSLPPNLVNNGVVIDSSAARLSTWSRDGNAFTLRIASYPGHTYTLQTTQDLSAGWSDVETKPGATDTELVFTHDGGPSPRRFYRIAIGP